MPHDILERVVKEKSEPSLATIKEEVPKALANNVTPIKKRSHHKKKDQSARLSNEIVSPSNEKPPEVSPKNLLVQANYYGTIGCFHALKKEVCFLIVDIIFSGTMLLLMSFFVPYLFFDEEITPKVLCLLRIVFTCLFAIGIIAVFSISRRIRRLLFHDGGLEEHLR